MKDLVSNQLIRYLEERGIEHIFGLCGHTNIAVLAALSKSEEVWEEMLGLDVEEQVEVFGQTISPADDDECAAYALAYVRHLFSGAHDEIERGKLLVPALKKLLREVDIENGRIVFAAQVLEEVGCFAD